MDLVAWGGLVILSGMLALGYVGSRDFNRTNSHGVQEFSGYLHMTACRAFERLLKIAGVLALFAGFVLGTMGMPKQMKEARAHAAERSAAAASQPTANRPRGKPVSKRTIRPATTQVAHND